MINKKINKKLLLTSVILAGFSFSAQAQLSVGWAVSDASTHQLLGGVNSGLDTVQATLGVQIKQQDDIASRTLRQKDEFQLETDNRVRAASFELDVMKKDMAAMPTLKQCAELTKAQANSGSVGGMNQRNATKSGGGGKREDGREGLIKDSVSAKNLLLEAKIASDSCNKFSLGIGSCSSAGSLAGADSGPGGIMGNTENGEYNSDTGKRSVLNHTLSEKGMLAATANANNATMYSAPAAPTQKLNEANPAYAATYDSLMTKLSSAKHALLTIAERMATTKVDNRVAEAKQDFKKDWDATFKNVYQLPSGNPSLMDQMKLAAFRDFWKTTKTMTEVGSPESVALKSLDLAATANMISLQRLEEQQNTNVLLSHILVQLTTPVKIEEVNNELAKTKNIR